jgi:putative DNA primase/helicase
MPMTPPPEDRDRLRAEQERAGEEHLSPESAPTEPPKKPAKLVDLGAHRGDALPTFSDEALALRFAAQNADKLRFVNELGHWFQWSGRHWKEDRTLVAFDAVRALCREAARRANKLKERGAEKIASRKTVAAVACLARADRRLAATAAQWDADPWLLNTPGGMVDLKTSELRPHRLEDYCTKMTAVAPGGECPRWLATLSYIFGGNAEIVSFLQRWAGYSLTGVTSEQKFLFAYGTGANGKGVTSSTMAGVLGDYAMAAPVAVFMASNSDRTELAMLRGARLVTASETEAGRAWAESRIKQLTGGDKISARFMRRDFFEFTPQFKFLIAGNHKPSLRSVDEAMRRRFLFLPFLVTIPEGERDPDLTEKLKAEWPGILAWMIAGCIDWQERGLRPPSAVLLATKTHLEAEDAFQLWLADATTREANAWEATRELFLSWTSWALAAGEKVGDEKNFAAALEAAGFAHAKNPEQTKRASGASSSTARIFPAPPDMPTDPTPRNPRIPPFPRAAGRVRTPSSYLDVSCARDRA